MSSSFADLGVDPFFIERLGERGITNPTEIQSQVIPQLLAGSNTLFSSATGTGKTFAYLIPLLQTLRASPPPAAEWPALLICAPTYELCSQIKQEADFLLAGFPKADGPLKAGGLTKVSLLIGAGSMGRQIDGLKKDKPQVIIGNPGRLLQLGRMGKLRLARLRFLVLDEGDRLVADELFEETSELIRLIPAKGAAGITALGINAPDTRVREHLTAVCSATLPPKSRDRLLPFLGSSPVTEEHDGHEVIRDRILHWAIFSEGRRKISTLRSFLAAARPRKALVFTARGGDVGNIVSQLQYHHLAASGLYGDMDKKTRKQALDDFRRDRLQILVTSDLAARGLDIAGISHIIALDVPNDSEAYIHRAGRTARAGNRGIVVTIGGEDEMRRLAALEKKLGIVVYPKELYNGKIAAPEDLPD
ncbi:DEAD/DEAH box helicase [Spirochaetia bacterium]|nr:DEAD/DEAH box helicase [Spirochaetia bacterium]